MQALLLPASRDLCVTITTWHDAFAQMMMVVKRRKVHPMLSMRYGGGDSPQTFIPELMWNKRETDIFEEVGLS